jgi:hypothetical protein
MVRDEAPAATRWLNWLEGPLAEITIFSAYGPISLVAAEIHLGQSRRPFAPLAALQHSSCVPARRSKKETLHQ